jgi:hypothetical protein
MPQILSNWGIAPEINETSSGKSETFRISGGRAAKDFIGSLMPMKLGFARFTPGYFSRAFNAPILNFPDPVGFVGASSGAL